MPPSKTARRSTPQVSKTSTPADLAGFAASAASARIISLNSGNHCYLANPLGGRSQLATSSEKFDAVLRDDAALNPAYGARLCAEITALAEQYPNSAWPSVLARVTATGGALAVNDAGEVEEDAA